MTLHIVIIIYSILTYPKSQTVH